MIKKYTKIALLATFALAFDASAGVIVNASTSCSPLSGSGTSSWDSLEANGTVNSSCGESSAWASVDSDTATMKLYTNATTTPGSVYNGAWANAAIYDTITLLSELDYVQVALELYFHFDVSANYTFPAGTEVLTAPNARNFSPGALSRIQGEFGISGYDYNAEPDNYEEIYGRYRFNADYEFNFQAGPFIANNYPSEHLVTERFNDTQTESFDLPNARSSGFVISQILNLPSNSTLDLFYSIDMSQICSLAALCNLTADGSNTFSIGLTALNGTLVSENGYGYQPANGSPNAVSAPATLGMFALGLLMLARRRIQ
ncbi:hypothetical protein ORJ04_17960 [Rheinheimera baltica]|uniref:PEP-CTERM protein-sorting domain-containing protein n=1 Tax=Rheinheimera baltica TaxID=67576 RepID=A0ABT9I387_9GAMM|nr:hypothetical protein [Rheinheimera baltica]MDP5137842.1 hypothetical protein [Rheinheimera baltica]